ncbi:hypothetical protein CR513_22604, partial [Mucuna pruriens]
MRWKLTKRHNVEVYVASCNGYANNVGLGEILGEIGRMASSRVNWEGFSHKFRVARLVLINPEPISCNIPPEMARYRGISPPERANVGLDVKRDLDRWEDFGIWSRLTRVEVGTWIRSRHAESAWRGTRLAETTSSSQDDPTLNWDDFIWDSNFDLQNEQHRRDEERRDEGKGDADLDVGKCKILLFEGNYKPEVYIDWELKVEQMITSFGIQGQIGVRLVTLVFGDYSLIWWTSMLDDIRRGIIKPYENCYDLKCMMRKRFVSSSYIRDIHHKLQSLSVEEFYKEMKMTMLRAQIRERRRLPLLGLKIESISAQKEHLGLEKWSWPRPIPVAKIIPAYKEQCVIIGRFVLASTVVYEALVRCLSIEEMQDQELGSWKLSEVITWYSRCTPVGKNLSAWPLVVNHLRDQVSSTLSRLFEFALSRDRVGFVSTEIESDQSLLRANRHSTLGIFCIYSSFYIKP